MKDLFVASLLLVLVVAEGAIWIRNPMHVPAGFTPARATGFQVFQEDGAAMEPNIKSGQHVLVSAWAYWWGTPRVGDVIAFVYPPDPSTADLKRIVAAGGSSVEIHGGIIYVDGKPPEGATPVQARGSMPKRLIPLDSYFVMSDDPNDRDDSRRYGFIARDRVIGKQWL